MDETNTVSSSTSVSENLNESEESTLENNNVDLIVVGSWMIMGKLSSPGKKILKKIAGSVKTN